MARTCKKRVKNANRRVLGKAREFPKRNAYIITLSNGNQGAVTNRLQNEVASGKSVQETRNEAQAAEPRVTSASRGGRRLGASISTSAGLGVIASEARARLTTADETRMISVIQAEDKGRPPSRKQGHGSKDLRNLVLGGTWSNWCTENGMSTERNTKELEAQVCLKAWERKQSGRDSDEKVKLRLLENRIVLAHQSLANLRWRSASKMSYGILHISSRPWHSLGSEYSIIYANTPSGQIAELPIVFRSVFPLYADLPTLKTSVFYAELSTVFRSGDPYVTSPHTLKTSVFYAELPIVFRSAFPSLRLHWPTLKIKVFGTAAQYGYYNSTFTGSPHGWNCKRETDGGSAPSSENEKIEREDTRASLPMDRKKDEKSLASMTILIHTRGVEAREPVTSY
ncbi:hypothetical protein DFH08DRAFT_940598 [Mycena albidolilacea]|uniref:Uncharacterized protein n=1 Tax=Mycena albidolilacea TaxID=1033008 RepID=A0AAD6ZLU1_9AGAR|nr:hypothetical protein DFH08DRAFT_940598 [Mycena albidolilacea]